MVAEIKALCKKAGTSVSQLEKTLGFGNGSIRKWDTSPPAFERVQKVADYFGVSPAQLADSAGETEKAPQAETQGADMDEVTRRLHYLADYGEPGVKKLIVEFLDRIDNQK